jgi:hypothetical protein
MKNINLNNDILFVDNLSVVVHKNQLDHLVDIF